MDQLIKGDLRHVILVRVLVLQSIRRAVPLKLSSFFFRGHKRSYRPPTRYAQTPPTIGLSELLNLTSALSDLLFGHKAFAQALVLSERFS